MKLKYSLVLAVLIVLLAVFDFWGLWSRRVSDNGSARLDRVFSATTVPEDWVRAGNARLDPIDGKKWRAGDFEIGELRFSTFASVKEVLSSYIKFADQKGWKLIREDIDASVLVFEPALDERFEVTIDGFQSQDEVVVRLTRHKIAVANP